MSDASPLTPAELAKMGRLQAANATTRVFDPDSETIIDVPTNELKGYIDAGFRYGPDADLAKEEAGPLGYIASGALGIARGTSMGLSDFAIPKNLRVLQQQSEELNPVISMAGEIGGNLATLGAAGAGGAALAARAGYAKFAGLGAAAARTAVGAAEGGARAAVDAERNNSPLTAERFLQGVGMGMLINAAGEGAGKVLKHAVPKFQRTIGRLLERASESGYLERLSGQSMDAFAPGLAEGVPTGAEVEALQKEARAAFGNFQSVNPELPGPVSEQFRTPLRGGSAGGPPPLPGRPALTHSLVPEVVESAELVPENASQALGRKTAQMPAPMSEAESRLAWDQLDREAADASRMGTMEGMEGVADDLRAERDYYSKNRGLSASELAARDEKLAALAAPDAEFDRAFSNLEGGATEAGTELRPQLTLEGGTRKALPPPLTEVGFKTRKPRVGALSTLAKQELRGVANSAELPLPLPGEIPYQPILPEKFAPTKYGVKGDRGVLQELYRKGPLAGALHMIPGVGPQLSAAYSIGQGTLYGAKRAVAATLNHQQALNMVLDRVLAPAAKMSGTVVKNLMQSMSPELSSVYLGGNVDDEYAAISQGAINAASDPEAMESYYQQRYGAMLRTQPELYGNIVAQSAKQHAYVASLVPKDPRADVGMLDEPYDPPRTDKLKVIQAYKAVNDPYSILTSPTVEGVAAVAETHPETLKLIQKLLVAELTDPKKVKKLTPERKAQLSMVLQLPVSASDTPGFIAGLQEMATANGAPPAPQAQSGPAQGPNFGQQASQQFASAVASPSQQNELDSLT